MKKVTWFTANSEGGVLQLCETLNAVACDMGWDSLALAPEGVGDWAIGYKKSLHPAKLAMSLKDAAEPLIARRDGIIVFCDTATYTLLTARKLGLGDSFFINHDVIDHGLAKTASAYERASRVLNLRLKPRCLNGSAGVVVLSHSSLEQYAGLYPANTAKIHLMPLGAHIVSKESCKPPELGECSDYALFFGRIEPYKGVERLLHEWARYGEHGRRQLVIAGSGSFSDAERDLLDSLEGLVVINRFIRDEEMNWLFGHAAFSVLPYLKATQSGVIPISYFFGRPVVVSDDPGLSEFVREGSTGLICGEREGSFASCFGRLWADSAALEAMGCACRVYYAKNLEWSTSVPRLLEELATAKCR